MSEEKISLQQPKLASQTQTPAVTDKKDVPAPQPDSSSKNTQVESASEIKPSNGEKALPQSDKKAKKKKKKGGQIYFTGISKLVVLVSIRNLYLMLRSGLALNEAVRTLADQTPDERLQKIYLEIGDKIDGGQNLADSMKDYPKVFSDIIVSVVTVGEQGGTLEKNLLFLADYLKKAHTLGKKIQGALIYPGIVFLLTFVEMLGVIFLILPKLEDLFTSFEDIPSMTKAILTGSQFIRENSIILAISLVVVIGLFFLFLRSKSGKRFKDIAGLKTPVIKKLNENNILASFARTLSILLETGIPLVNALDIATSTVSNSVYKKVLEKVVADVKSGRSVADSLSDYDKHFPPTFIKMIEVGESTGTLEENLGYLYDYHAEEVEELANNLSTLLEPLLLIVIGFMIGGLALIIIGPIYQLTGSINEV
ncbi:type II secretion system F family protein [Candidatus Dojkabacteria bacterium]|uniref:Type II secretion system F family protein n=1 Tax=Candidatus Dojkabacteria bacterium TaxID=2099670 RepID=A0A955LAK4_9BACT|nr:type II secretion system F family protein [Candidatus Dojkabacteria bacterium]